MLLSERLDSGDAVHGRGPSGGDADKSKSRLSSECVRAVVVSVVQLGVAVADVDATSGLSIWRRLNRRLAHNTQQQVV
jgi:hypothetical protein